MVMQTKPHIRLFWFTTILADKIDKKSVQTKDLKIF